MLADPRLVSMRHERDQRADQAAVGFHGAGDGPVAVVDLSSSYFRRRPYNCVRVSPSRAAALDLFQWVWAITFGMRYLHTNAGRLAQGSEQQSIDFQRNAPRRKLT